MDRVELYTDGAARGNPEGPGGYGAILVFYNSKGERFEKEISQGYIKTTNNRMELMAVIRGLEALVKPCEVLVYSDSKYLVDAFLQDWIGSWEKANYRKGKKNEVKNIDLWKYLRKIMKPHQVSFHWVKGHAGHPMNERCDQLATRAADGEDLIEDRSLES